MIFQNVVSWPEDSGSISLYLFSFSDVCEILFVDEWLSVALMYVCIFRSTEWYPLCVLVCV